MLTLLGAACLLYYAVLCVALKKWDSTFSRFWLAAGLGLWLYDYAAVRLGMEAAARKALLLPVAVFVVTELRIVMGMVPRGQKEYDYLIILGAHVEGRKITDSLYRRLNKALIYLKAHPGTRAVVSGGQGAGEDVTEAQAMKDYLIAQGIASYRIIKEEASTTTQENLKFSKRYMNCGEADVGIVSNNFHLYRACAYARRLGYGHPYPLAASCHPALLVNYMVRECFAVWKMWLFF